MKKIVVRKPGGHEALELVEEPDKTPGPGEVRVRVRAAGVNYADAIVRMGYYAAAKGRYPITPGFEFAGEIDAGGSRFKPGDRVFGFMRFGAYASSVVVSETQVFSCPDDWTFEECAAFPAVYLTAYHGLFQVARVQPGERLLVHSAAGGVGTALLQLAKIAGCPTIGVVGSAAKVDFARRMSATHVVVRGPRLWDELAGLAADGFDVIFDANGVETAREGYKRLAAGGRLVVYGFADIMPRGKARPRLWDLAWNYLRVPKFSPIEMTTTNRGVMGFNLAFLFHKPSLAREAMQRLLLWIGQKRIQKPLVTTFPLERAGDAHKAIESGTTTGKLVLTA